MRAKVTYYLDITSSWCYWVEPAWLQLRSEYKAEVEFQWKIALMDASGLPVSRNQLEWFYRRSGTITRSHFMLNSGWYDPNLKEYLAPNCMAEAARTMGITDDSIRLSLATAALRHGERIGDWQTSARIAARASGLEEKDLLEKARSSEIENIVRESTREYHDFKMKQRPAFLIENDIGDRVVFSGVVANSALAAAIEALLDDSASYASYLAHFGAIPAS